MKEQEWDKTVTVIFLDKEGKQIKSIVLSIEELLYTNVEENLRKMLEGELEPGVKRIVLKKGEILVDELSYSTEDRESGKTKLSWVKLLTLKTRI